MDNNLIASKSIEIHSSVAKLWEVLTQPEKIKHYLFGTETQTDWKPGSSILFTGEYNGQVYKDKGNVLENSVHKLLKYNYWSSFSGLEDTPENYATVTYKIEELGSDKVNFSWIQQGFATKEGQCHTQQGLEAMLKQIKQLAEE